MDTQDLIALISSNFVSVPELIKLVANVVDGEPEAGGYVATSDYAQEMTAVADELRKLALRVAAASRSAR